LLCFFSRSRENLICILSAILTTPPPHHHPYPKAELMFVYGLEGQKKNNRKYCQGSSGRRYESLSSSLNLKRSNYTIRLCAIGRVEGIHVLME
jgi:hypothetical protein